MDCLCTMSVRGWEDQDVSCVRKKGTLKRFISNGPLHQRSFVVYLLSRLLLFLYTFPSLVIFHIALVNDFWTFLYFLSFVFFVSFDFIYLFIYLVFFFVLCVVVHFDVVFISLASHDFRLECPTWTKWKKKSMWTVKERRQEKKYTSVNKQQRRSNSNQRKMKKKQM